MFANQRESTEIGVRLSLFSIESALLITCRKEIKRDCKRL